MGVVVPYILVVRIKLFLLIVVFVFLEGKIILVQRKFPVFVLF